MNVSSLSSYSTNIYNAIIVNTDIDQDPDLSYRVQIYIPVLQPELANMYESYMNDSNKTESEYFTQFPWAKSALNDLEEGNVVYGTFINNDNNDYIILGYDGYNPVNAKSTDGGAYDVSGAGLLELTMPIILHHEVGIAVNDYPDNISSSKYSLITPYDNGGWSIGLIQWHECRAYDCLLYIAQHDSSWTSNWTDKSLALYKDLANNDSSARTKYGSSFHPTAGTAQYTSIQNMLSSENGKQYQLEYAKEDTQSYITNLMEDYSISNPAVIIFLSDIMNQYGSGINSTKSKASQLCETYTDMMEAFHQVVTWCQNNLGSYNTYKSRRDATITYIEQLNDEGKLNVGGLTGEIGSVSSSGFCFPVERFIKSNRNISFKSSKLPFL